VQEELLGDMGHRSADEPEGDAVRALEADGLERSRDQAADSGEVLGEHHVRAPLEDAELALERARRPLEVWRRDHLEYEFPRRLDLYGQRAKRTQIPADAHVDREPAPRKKRGDST
jgi:hypothetical protein